MSIPVQWNILQGGYVWPFGLGVAAGFDEFGANFGNAIGLNGELDIYVEPSYRFTLSAQSAVILGVKFGFSDYQPQNNLPGGNSVDFSGQYVAPEVYYQFLFSDRVGLNLGLEYRYASLAYNQSYINAAYTEYGLGVQLGLTVYFHRLYE